MESTTSRTRSAASWLTRLRHFQDRSNLDATPAGAGNAGRDLDRVVQVLRLHQVVATQLLPGLREGTVRRRDLPIPHPDRGRAARGLQRVATDVVAALLDAFRVVVVLAAHGFPLRRRRLLPCTLVAIDQAQVPHGSLR